MSSFAADYKTRLVNALDTIPLERVMQAIEWLKDAREQGRGVYVCGNGGSGSSASHFVCDMLKGASYGRDQRFRIISLIDSLPTVLAYANDVTYDAVFVEQLKNFAQPGDVLIALSGSGNSKNVIEAVNYANANGLRTIGLTGRDGGKLGPISQLEINVAEPHMGRIEDGHMIALHMICYYFMEETGKSC